MATQILPPPPLDLLHPSKPWFEAAIIPLLQLKTPRFGLKHAYAFLGYFRNAVTTLKQSTFNPNLLEPLALTLLGSPTQLPSETVDCPPCNGTPINLTTDPKAKAALTIAHKLIDEHGFVSDDDVQQFQAAGFGEQELLDLLSVANLSVFTQHMNRLTQTHLGFPLFKTTPLTLQPCSCITL